MGSEPGSVGQYLLNNRAEIDLVKVRLGAVETQGAATVADFATHQNVLATHQNVLDALNAAVARLDTLAVTEDRFMELIYSVDVFGVEQVIGLATVNLKNNTVVNVQPYVSDAILKSGFKASEATPGILDQAITQIGNTSYNFTYFSARAPEKLAETAPNGSIIQTKLLITDTVTTPNAEGKYEVTLEIPEGYTWSTGDALVAEDVAIVFDILDLYGAKSAGGLSIPAAVDTISVSESNPLQFSLELNVYPGTYAIYDIVTGLRAMPHAFYADHIGTVAAFEARNKSISPAQPQLGDLLVTQLETPADSNAVKVVKVHQGTAKNVGSLTIGATSGFSLSGAYPENPHARLQVSETMVGAQSSTLLGNYFKQYWTVGVVDEVGEESNPQFAWTLLNSGDISTWEEGDTPPTAEVLANDKISMDSSVRLGFGGAFFQDQYYKVDTDAEGKKTVSTTKALMGLSDWRKALKAVLSTSDVVSKFNAAFPDVEYYNNASLLPTADDPLTVTNTGIGVDDDATAVANALAILSGGSDGIAKNGDVWEVNGVPVGPICLVVPNSGARTGIFERAAALLGTGIGSVAGLGFDVELLQAPFGYIEAWIMPTSAQIGFGLGAYVNSFQDSTGAFREIAGLGLALNGSMDLRSILGFFTTEKPIWNIPAYDAIYDELMGATEQSVIDQKLRDLQTQVLITDAIVVPLYRRESRFFYRNDVVEVKRDGFTKGPPGSFLRPAPALRAIDNLVGNI